VAILKDDEASLTVAELCCKHGISSVTYSAWKSKCAGSTVADLTRMRELEAENACLKRMYAELVLVLVLDAAAMKEVIARKW
jgi:putative transposase